MRYKHVNKQQWVELFRTIGLTDDAMQSWHREFEKSSPEGHQDFLESIGITSEEIASIRERSRLEG